VHPCTRRTTSLMIDPHATLLRNQEILLTHECSSWTNILGSPIKNPFICKSKNSDTVSVISDHPSSLPHSKVHPYESIEMKEHDVDVHIVPSQNCNKV
jgi:hypothetical protein